MSSKAYVLETMQRTGREAAESLQARSGSMTGTEITAEAAYLPDFDAAVQVRNMLERPAGQENGFVCRSAAGRVVRLLQNYDSDIYTQQPEELAAQWGFYWSTDPQKALPFLSLATSPYQTGDCCTYDGRVWRSGQDNNTWAPGTANVQWEDLGAVEDVIYG